MPRLLERCSAAAHLIIGAYSGSTLDPEPPSLLPRCSLTVAPHPAQEHNNCTLGLLCPHQAAPKP